MLQQIVRGTANMTLIVLRSLSFLVAVGLSTASVSIGVLLRCSEESGNAGGRSRIGIKFSSTKRAISSKHDSEENLAAEERSG